MLLKRLRARDERGQSLTEFALALPILVIILFATAEFGFALNNQVAMVAAARNGARVAALEGVGSPTLQADVQQAVQDGARSLLVSCPIVTPITPQQNAPSSGGGGQVGSWTVTAQCTYTAVTPLSGLLSLISSSLAIGPISYSVTMRDTSCNPPTCTP